MKKLNSEKGSALMVVVVLGAILTFAVGALLTTTYNEHRSSVYSYLNSAAFHLAESGVDFAAEAIAAGSFPSSTWKSASGGGYIYQSGAIGNGSYTVACIPITSGYEVRSCGVAVNDGAKLSASRAVRVRLTSGTPKGIVAKDGITFGNDTAGANQGYVRVASYKSSKGAPIWGGSNFGSNALVAVTANTATNKGPLAINAATIYGKLAIGGESTAEVYSNSRAKVVTADSSSTTVDSSKIVKDYSYDFPTPLVPDVDNTWTVITPSEVTGSQYTSSGKLSELPNTVTAAKYSGSTLDVGAQNKSTFILASSADNINKINVSGDVVLFFAQNANLNSTTVHFNDTSATLKLYFCGDVSAIPNPDNADFAPSRYQINVLPTGSAPNFTSTTASDIINDALNVKIKAAATAGASVQPGVTINYGSTGKLAATINAPFSDVQMSAGNSLGANQFRGSLFAKKITTTGGDFLDIYSDEDETSSPTWANWRQIMPQDVPTS